MYLKKIYIYRISYYLSKTYIACNHFVKKKKKNLNCISKLFYFFSEYFFILIFRVGRGILYPPPVTPMSKAKWQMGCIHLSICPILPNFISVFIFISLHIFNRKCTINYLRNMTLIKIKQKNKKHLFIENLKSNKKSIYLWKHP